MKCNFFFYSPQVTMEFWDGLWLNESFATFMGEVVVTDMLYPEWNIEAEVSRL